jgi:hypothetical protein
MSVFLEAVKLNHDGSSATSDALNVRRNKTTMVNVPEWVRGVSVQPEDAPAAYSIAETKGNTLTIQARFSTDKEKLKKKGVEIRAVDPAADPPGGPGCAGGCLGILKWLGWLIRLLVGNVLGDVKARQVSFDATGWTAFETFEREHVRLWDVGVGVHTTTWRWQYRDKANGPWIDFATSDHRVYVLLELPKAPWQQTPYNAGNTQLPWTDVLDRACMWGFGATSRDAAAAKITANVYGLGPSVVQYDCPNGGMSWYSGGVFSCAAFLERLTGGIGLGIYVNCSDCATIVSTFANAVGCDLWQSRMGPQTGYWFDLNELLAIGSNVWQTACSWGNFNYHEVAWKDGCTANDPVWDACLQVDGDPDPTSAPHVPLLPVGLRFGTPGSMEYLDRLVAPGSRPNCVPKPATSRTRRTVA